MKGAEPHQVIAGFPEFWQQVYRRFPRFFEAARQLEPIQNKMFRTAVQGALPVVVGRIAVGVANSFGALITLALNGYGADAMRIARSMFEGELTAVYLQQHPEQLRDYLDFFWIQHKSVLDCARQYAPQQFQRVGPDVVAETERQFQTLGPRFGDRRGKPRHRWTTATVRKMAEEAGLGELYFTVYSWASAMHHADIQGLQVTSEAPTGALAVAPSEQWVKEALCIGHGSTLRVLECYNEVAQLGMEGDLKKARQGFLTAWKT